MNESKNRVQKTKLYYKGKQKRNHVFQKTEYLNVKINTEISLTILMGSPITLW